MKFIIIFFIVALISPPTTASSQSLGLIDAVQSNQRGYFDLYTGGYVPVYKTTISNVATGEIFRISGQIEASEKQCSPAKLWSYLRVTTPSGAMVRVSPYAWQWANRSNNHHMPLYNYGSYAATTSGNYEVELMARATNTQTATPELCNAPGNPDVDWAELVNQGIATKNMWVEFITKPTLDTLGNVSNIAEYNSYASDYGKIIVERYRQPSGSGLYRGVVDFERQFVFGSATILDTPNEDNTKPFLMSKDDILRAQSLVTSQFLGGNNLVSAALRIKIGTSIDRVSVATENTVAVLFRHSLINDALYVAPSAASVIVNHEVHGAVNDTDPYLLPANNREIATLQFSTFGTPKFLIDTTYTTLSSDLYIDQMNAGIPITVTEYQDTGSPGDIIRVQSQVQADLQVGSVASCYARIEIYEGANGSFVRKYLSVVDQRYVSTEHPSGAYSPFALYKLSNTAVDYKVRLIARCASSQSMYKVFFKNYGQGLIVDRFGN